MGAPAKPVRMALGSLFIRQRCGYSHYEESKHLTAAGRAELTNEEARRIAEKYGLKFKFVEKLN